MALVLISKENILLNCGKKLYQTLPIKYSSTDSPTIDDRTLPTSEQQVKHGPRRDMSKLLRQNRNVLLQIKPFDEPCSWIHLTEKYNRKLFGRYGLVSGMDPYICFSMREKVYSNHSLKKPSLQQLISNAKTSESNRNEMLEYRENDIAAKLVKLEQWKIDMRNKIAKKEADVLALREQKQRIMEEVRRHFGFKVDPKDDRFKEMLEQKEREEKKKQKEAKRKAREDRMMVKLAEKTIRKSDH